MTKQKDLVSEKDVRQLSNGHKPRELLPEGKSLIPIQTSAGHTHEHDNYQVADQTP